MNRSEFLVSWLAQFFKEEKYHFTPLLGDASFRHYGRVITASASYIVMDAPPPETTVPFIEIAHLLKKQGLCAPEIISCDVELGFLLLSDLGDRLYLQALQASRSPEGIDTLYQHAISALVKIHACRPTGLSWRLPDFDAVFIEKQLGVFKTWYLERHLLKENTVSVPSILTAWTRLEPLMHQLAQTILLQPKVFIHRDYHSRNLMVLEKDNPGILDFQDAMMGPITYDLVSLLQDCYIAWPRKKVLEWALLFKRMLVEVELLSPNIQDEQFIQWMDWTGLQRHLKNLGIFTRLYYRDGKSRYLSDIPMLLQYISETCQRYAELKPLWSFFEHIVPIPVTRSLELE